MNDYSDLISREDVEYIAHLAHLRFTDEEMLDCQKKLGSILGYMQELRNIDTTGVEPTTHVLPLTNVFREDVVTNGDERDKILLNAPEQKDGAFKVPKTVE